MWACGNRFGGEPNIIFSVSEPVISGMRQNDGIHRQSSALILFKPLVFTINQYSTLLNHEENTLSKDVEKQ